MSEHLKDTRRKQRFENFEKACHVLHQELQLYPLDQYPDVVQKGVIQTFEVCIELGWKLLKDKLLAEGVALERITPKFVIQKAFEAKLITDGQGWIDMIETRNSLAHEYNEQKFREAFQIIATRYADLLFVTNIWKLTLKT